MSQCFSFRLSAIPPLLDTLLRLYNAHNARTRTTNERGLGLFK